MKKYSEDRSLTTNILWCLFALVGLVVVPSLIFFVLMYFFTTSDGFILSLYELFANFIFIGALILIYFKDLKREFKIFKIIYKLPESCHNCKAAVIRYLSEEHIKIYNLILHAVCKITVCHCHFVKINQHCQIS